MAREAPLWGLPGLAPVKSVPREADTLKHGNRNGDLPRVRSQT